MHLSGSITALATPFLSASRPPAPGDIPHGQPGVDMAAWHRLLQTQRAQGTQAVVVAGSTGEANALDDEEYAALLTAAVGTLRGQMPVLAGTGTSNTAKTIAATRRAAALGADVALVVTPPYVRPTQAGLIAHYRAVADEGDLPVLLYNVPGRTGCDLLPETVAQLVDHPRIVGIKEAVATPERMQALLALRAPGFAVLSGDDPTAMRAMLAGADGTISVASNVLPAAFRRLCDLARAGRSEAAAAWDARLQPVFDFLGVEPNPIPVKAVLAAQGIGDGLRLPLTTLSPVHADALAQVLAAVEALERDAASA